MSNKRYLLIVFFILGFITITIAQEVPINKLRSYGLLVDIPFVEEELSEGEKYSPTIFQINLRFPLLKNETRHQLTLLLQPQYVHVKPLQSQPGINLFEAGVNVGFAYEYLINPNVGIVYAGLGVGPHYFNAETGQQASGFTFSDNFYVGMHHFLGNRSFFLTYEVRFRHLSNAGLVEPNLGLDNFFVGLGLSYFLHK